MKLRPFAESDWPRVGEILTSRDVAKTYMLPDFAALEEAKPLFDRMKQLSEGHDCFVRVMEEGGAPVGIINDVGIHGDAVELGYAVHPACWGRGYATAALGLAIAELFDRGYREIIAGAFAENAASLRCMEKCGMTVLAKTDRIEYRGRTRECVYRIIRKDVAV
ncbi:MAG: GNAT family N-acetyltransferase [Oscillospiraceae bacterium]|nr:GNAT family N-acetyltransferase [Oscillospiraceae bacterium]